MDDKALIESLTTVGARRPSRIDPRESGLMRAAVLVAAPAWLAGIATATLSRILRARLPLFVLHERVGFGRAVLWVPKIATASVAENERRLGGLVQLATGPPAELDVDGRVEHWLRVTGADELPQLLLVVAGSMRLVGPRPVTADELAEMAPEGSDAGIDHLHPGIVGLWQLLDRHRYELRERRDLDMLMIDNWSRTLRARILGMSVRQLATRVLRRSAPSQLNAV